MWCLCVFVSMCVWIFLPYNFFKWSSLFGCHVSLAGNSQLGPPETSVPLPSPPLPSLRYMKTKFFNVTCHFFWTKGWSLLVTKIPWNHIHTRCLVLSPHKEKRLQLLLAMARNLSIGTRRKQKLKT